MSSCSICSTSWHRVIAKTPNQAAKPANDAPKPRGVTRVTERLGAASHKLGEKYRATARVINRGDHVRVALNVLDRSKIKKEEKGFAKGYVQQWSTAVYEVVVKTRADALNRATVPYYLLRKVGEAEQLPTKFYRQQLLWVPAP